ncbi:MAG: hypothetical protein QNJ77_09330 [Acidimicrobiia bacterium]|nr:hypothetical protein [Acidimicrobiia bacterium]
MSVPLPTVPENQEGEDEMSEDTSVAQARHEAAEIVADARRQAEAIVAEARATEPTPASSPLAALGDNAEEIIGQVRKLIKKQRQLQDERKGMQEEIEALKAERDELVQRLTDAVERMEELAALAAHTETTPTPAPPPAQPQPQPSPEPTSLAARLEKAEREEREQREREAQLDAGEPVPEAPAVSFDDGLDDEMVQPAIGSDRGSFYSRHSAKLPRLEGDGGRSALSVIGDMRPDPEPKGRKGRRRKKS